MGVKMRTLAFLETYKMLDALHTWLHNIPARYMFISQHPYDMYYFGLYTVGSYWRDYRTCPSSKNNYIVEPTFVSMAVFTQTHLFSYYTLPTRQRESFEWSRLLQMDKVQLVVHRGFLESLHTVKCRQLSQGSEQPALYLLLYFSL